MKLSALLTWTVVVAFTVATTSATQQCTFKFEPDSGCKYDDVVQVVDMINIKFEQEETVTAPGDRALNEKVQKASSPTTGLRGAQAQQDRELFDCYRYCRLCNNNPICDMTCYVVCGMRDLQDSTTASASETVDLGEEIKTDLETFGWDECDPNKVSMKCDDIPDV